MGFKIGDIVTLIPYLEDGKMYGHDSFHHSTMHFDGQRQITGEDEDRGWYLGDDNTFTFTTEMLNYSASEFPTPREMRPGDMVKLRVNLVEGARYGKRYFSNAMYYSGVRKVREVFQNGVHLKGNLSVYDTEMFDPPVNPETDIQRLERKIDGIMEVLGMCEYED